MYLKRIELNGFKSFADKTEFVINHKITGIVGPNGSGKSNIADAIRWVLGEQSSKNLRGEKMEDVIFNGTQLRSKKAFCQVSLVFDNSDGRIRSDFEEIVIARKMYRSGESEYFLNNISVRLRDVLELIRDTGIGKEGYSIIGQGRMDEILASKPTARRKVFEEAAGIMKFRTRKEEAERKLERTGENLVRVEDILEELQVQLEPLEKQAEQTRRYNTLYEKQKRLDSGIFVYNWDRSQRRRDALQEELFLILAELKESEGAGAAEDLESLSAELERAELQSAELLRRQSDLNAEIERLEGQRNLILEREANANAEISRTEEKKAQRQAELSARQQEHTEASAQATALKQTLEALDGEIGHLSQSRAVAQSALDAQRREAESLKERQLSLMRDIAEEQSALSALNAAKESYAAREQELTARLSQSRQERESRAAQAAEQEREAARLDTQRSALISQINENNGVLLHCRKEAERLEAAAELAREKHSGAVSKRRILTDLKNEYEGYSGSVRGLMRDGKKQGLRLVGALAELIQVPAEYETAIEAVLGGALQNVVVRDEYDAKQAIKYLRSNNMGRVTFLPTQALRVGRMTQQERALADGEGFIGIASELLEYDTAAKAAVEFLLARTILVDTMDHAIAIMRRAEYAFRAVTLKGDVLRPGGSISGGGTAKKQFGLLSRERQIEALSAQIADLAAQQEAAEAEARENAMHMEAAAAQNASLAGQLKEMEIAIAAQKQKHTSGMEMAAAAQEAEALLAEQHRMLCETDAGAEARRREIEQRLAGRNAELASVQAKLEMSTPGESSEVEALIEQLNEKKIQRAEKAKELESCAQSAQRLQSEMEEMERASARYTTQAAELAAQLASLAQQMETLDDARDGREEAQKELTSQTEEAEAKKKALREALAERQRKNAELQEQRGALLERRFRAEAQIEKIDSSMEAMQQRMWEEYELTYGAAAELRPQDMGYAEVSRALQETREKLRELGNINPNAIEDFERLRERADMLSAQRDDLTKAEEDLKTIIDGLMREMSKTFLEKFKMINGHFKSVFQELFGGGNAEISLEEGDIMECGINISAEPPGKKLQHMSLLSGGERALTAIALLFAMIRINPSPVCLLDEIDAPLDEANVVRFASYLQNLQSSQFLVITHRKPTMSMCDTLYGVAMEEKGVSKLVSVDLEID